MDKVLNNIYNRKRIDKRISYESKILRREKRTSGPEMYIRMFHEDAMTCSCHDEDYAEIDFQ